MITQALLWAIKTKLIDIDDSVWVIAVSGGADSLALLHALVQLQPELPATLHVASFDHGMRGKDGAADVDFVEAICRKWDIPFSRGVNNPNDFSEAFARQTRYDFLVSVAKTYGTKTILTGHHADDQAETILMNMIRGTGLRGLRGMPGFGQVPGNPSFRLFRPFLSVTRSDILTYCQDHNLTPRIDVTNLDTKYTRNKIRHDLVPIMREMNPKLTEALNHVGYQAQETYDFLQTQAETWVDKHSTMTENVISIPREPFKQLHTALQQMVLWHASQYMGVKVDDFDHSNVEHALNVIGKGQVGKIAELPGHIHVRIDYDMIRVEHQNAINLYQAYLQMDEDSNHRLTLNEVFWVPNQSWGVIVTQEPKANNTAIQVSSLQNIQLRTRHTGDRIGLPNLPGHTKSLKKWMIDQKIPQSVRSQLPLIIVDNQIASLLLTHDKIVTFIPITITETVWIQVLNKP